MKVIKKIYMNSVFGVNLLKFNNCIKINLKTRKKHYLYDNLTSGFGEVEISKKEMKLIKKQKHSLYFIKK